MLNMTHKEYEMPDEYKYQLASLTEFYADRERFAKALPEIEPHLLEQYKRKMRELDKAIEDLEKMLAEQYERHQAEMAKEALLQKSLKEAWELTKHIYIIIKHQTPHLLEGFTTECLAPLTPEEREEFFDEVAILETNNLDAILNGEK